MLTGHLMRPTRVVKIEDRTFCEDLLESERL